VNLIEFTVYVLAVTFTKLPITLQLVGIFSGNKKNIGQQYLSRNRNIWGYARFLKGSHNNFNCSTNE
jgi:hypothetical protein